MASMRDLPPELVGNILTRVPITCLRAVRSTCKSWNSLSKEWTVGEAAARQQFLGFMTMGFKLYSVRFDLRGIQNDLVEQSVKQIALFDNVEIPKIFHVDGLVLLVTSSDLIVWNPYMEQQKWIGPKKFREFDNYAFGYDQNHNYKILMVTYGYVWEERKLLKGSVHSWILRAEYDIYDFNSDTWRILDKSGSDLIVWNPYMEQQKWIGPKKFREFDNYAFGYDQNHNYKILMVTYGYVWEERKLLKGSVHSWILRAEYDIYDFNSDTWRILDKSGSDLIVWNPYMEQQKWIGPKKFREFDNYAFGYDQNHNYKILMVTYGYVWEERKLLKGSVHSWILRAEYDIYDFNSDTWRILDVTPDQIIDPHQRGVTLKGNSTYFLATEKKEKEHCLLSFDFTKESFGQGLNLPWNSYEKFDTVTLSCICEERLAILRQKSRLYDFLDIWVTNKIEPNAVSWNKFFTVDIGKQIGFQFKRASFFIDEEKKLAVIFATTNNSPCDPTAYIIGEDGYFKSVTLGESMDEFSYISPQVSPFYLPSLLQIKQKRKRKRK